MVGRESVAEVREWTKFLADDPIFSLADDSTRIYISSWIELLASPANDPNMQEILRACAFYQRRFANQTPRSVPYPLVVLVLARWSPLYGRSLGRRIELENRVEAHPIVPNHSDQCPKARLYFHPPTVAQLSDGQHYVHRPGRDWDFEDDRVERCEACDGWLQRHKSPPVRPRRPSDIPQLMRRRVKPLGDGLWEIDEIRGNRDAPIWAMRHASVQDPEYGLTNYTTTWRSEKYREGYGHPLRPKGVRAWRPLYARTAFRNVAAWSLWRCAKVTDRRYRGIYSMADIANLLEGFGSPDAVKKAVYRVDRIVADVVSAWSSGSNP